MKSLVLALFALTLAAADKPTPRQKARELLDSAAEMVAATRPDVQAVALMHLADNYQTFDKKKSVEFFKQAFTAAIVPPVGQSPFARNTQMEIVVSLTTLDTGEGVALLKQMEPRTTGYDNRSFASSRVIGALLQKGQIPPAIELADYMGSSGAYPFSGVSQIMAKLPPGDNQFAAVFTSALNAYTVKPDRSFVSIVMRYRKNLPPGLAEAALPRILAAILSPKDEQDYQAQTFSSSKGTATFSRLEDSQLFDVAPLTAASPSTRSAPAEDPPTAP